MEQTTFASECGEAIPGPLSLAEISKHATRGPWSMGKCLSVKGTAVIGDGDSVVCLMADAVDDFCSFRRADAELIARAPDLLAEVIQLRAEKESLIAAVMDMHYWADEPAKNKFDALPAKEFLRADEILRDLVKRLGAAPKIQQSALANAVELARGGPAPTSKQGFA